MLPFFPRIILVGIVLMSVGYHFLYYQTIFLGNCGSIQWTKYASNRVFLNKKTHSRIYVYIYFDQNIICLFTYSHSDRVKTLGGQEADLVQKSQSIIHDISRAVLADFHQAHVLLQSFIMEGRRICFNLCICFKNLRKKVLLS